MKKLLSWILILTMLMTALVAFASCKKGGNDDDGENGDGTGTGGKKEPITQAAVEDLLSNVGTKMTDLDDMEVRIQLTLTMVEGSSTIAIPVEMVIKADDYRSENPAFSATFSYELMGERETYEFCLKDGWFYQTDGFDKEKFPAEEALEETMEELEEVLEMFAPTETEMAALEGLWADLLESSYATVDQNGVTEIKFETKLQDLLSALTAIVEGAVGDADISDMIDEEVAESLGMIEAVLEALSGDLTIVMTVKDNYVTKVETNIGAAVAIEGMSMNYNASLTIEIVNPGQSVTVSAPADADEYEVDGEDPGNTARPPAPVVPADPDEAIAKLEAAGYTITIGDSAESDNYAGYTVIANKQLDDGLPGQITVIYCESVERAEEAYDSFYELLEFVYSGESDIGIYNETIVWYTVYADIHSVFG